jgi:hypothetical protein
MSVVARRLNAINIIYSRGDRERRRVATVLSAVSKVTGKGRLMRAVWLGPLAALVIGALEPDFALAVPVIQAAPNASLTLLMPVRHHWHHGYWHHRHGRWSRYAPPYGPAPETNAAEAPASGYAPAPAYTPAPTAAYPTRPPAVAAPQTMPPRAARAPAPAAPSIEWVNPDRAAR